MTAPAMEKAQVHPRAPAIQTITGNFVNTKMIVKPTMTAAMVMVRVFFHIIQSHFAIYIWQTYLNHTIFIHKPFR